MEKEIKTSADWQKELIEITVIDPDGWDRKNYQYSWHEELITKEEYLRRRSLSTCMSRNK